MNDERGCGRQKSVFHSAGAAPARKFGGAITTVLSIVDLPRRGSNAGQSVNDFQYDAAREKCRRPITRVFSLSSLAGGATIRAGRASEGLISKILVLALPFDNRVGRLPSTW